MIAREILDLRTGTFLAVETYIKKRFSQNDTSQIDCLKKRNVFQVFA